MFASNRFLQPSFPLLLKERASAICEALPHQAMFFNCLLLTSVGRFSGHSLFLGMWVLSPGSWELHMDDHFPILAPPCFPAGLGT